MKKVSSRTLLALGLVAVMGFATPALASAGTLLHGSASQRDFHQQSILYRTSRHAIETAFRSAVHDAHVAYTSALVQASTSAQRSAARQTYEAAIIEAAATRSEALSALGAQPVKPS